MTDRGTAVLCIIVLNPCHRDRLCRIPVGWCKPHRHWGYRRHTCRSTTRTHRHSTRRSRVQYHCVRASAPFRDGQCGGNYRHTGNLIIRHSHRHRISSGHAAIPTDPMTDRGTAVLCIIVLNPCHRDRLCRIPVGWCKPHRHWGYRRHTCRSTTRTHRHSTSGSRVQYHCVRASASFGDGQCSWLYRHTGNLIILHSHRHRISSGHRAVATDRMTDRGALRVCVIVLNPCHRYRLCRIPIICCERHRHWGYHRHTCRTTTRTHRHSTRGSRIQYHCVRASASFGDGQCGWLYCHTPLIRIRRCRIIVRNRQFCIRHRQVGSRSRH